jgi:hypothetical protein
VQSGNVVTRLGSKLIISLYLDSKVGRSFEVVRCIYCGHPVIETLNPIKQIVDNAGNNDNLKVGLLIICKRCKQRYRVVLHERYLEI